MGTGSVCGAVVDGVALGTGAGAGTDWIGTGTICGAAITGAGAAGSAGVGSVSVRRGLVARRWCVADPEEDEVCGTVDVSTGAGVAAEAAAAGAGDSATAAGAVGSRGGGVIAADGAAPTEDVVVVLATFGCRLECATARAITTPTTTTIPRNISIRIFRVRSAWAVLSNEKC